MTFLFKRRNGGIHVRSTFQNPTMTDAVIFLQDNYEDKQELNKLIDERKVEVFAKVRDKTWHPMGVLTRGMFNSVKRGE